MTQTFSPDTHHDRFSFNSSLSIIAANPVSIEALHPDFVVC
jgi:hypothetical protein